jgi:hypothetical protein
MVKYSADCNREFRFFASVELAMLTQSSQTTPRSILQNVGRYIHIVIEKTDNWPVDVLDTFETIKVAVKYITPEGAPLYGFPADLKLVSHSLFLPDGI